MCLRFTSADDHINHVVAKVWTMLSVLAEDAGPVGLRRIFVCTDVAVLPTLVSVGFCPKLGSFSQLFTVSRQALRHLHEVCRACEPQARDSCLAWQGRRSDLLEAQGRLVACEDGTCPPLQRRKCPFPCYFRLFGVIFGHQPVSCSE